MCPTMSPSWLPIEFFRFHPAENILGRTPQLHTTRIFLGFTEPRRASRAAPSQPSRAKPAVPRRANQAVPSPPSHAKPTKLCSLPINFFRFEKATEPSRAAPSQLSRAMPTEPCRANRATSRTDPPQIFCHVLGLTLTSFSPPPPPSTTTTTQPLISHSLSLSPPPRR